MLYYGVVIQIAQIMTLMAQIKTMIARIKTLIAKSICKFFALISEICINSVGSVFNGRGKFFLRQDLRN